LIGAFFLNRLDAAQEKLDLFYVRFMDDILVLAPTRWKLRSAVKAVNQVLECLGLDKHPEKTFTGRVERGFDFLGYHFSRAGLSAAKQTVINFIERASRLYEQGRCTPLGVSPLGDVCKALALLASRRRGGDHAATAAAGWLLAVFRRLRHQASSPIPATMRPGSPAPTIGEGTGVTKPTDG
jgi:hypothetical protein